MHQTLNRRVLRWRLIESFLLLLVEALELVIGGATLVNVFAVVAQVKAAS